MKVLLSILTTVPKSHLAQKFSPWNLEKEVMRDGSVYVDSDPYIFKQILDFLYSGQSPPHDSSSYQKFVQELEFWGLVDPENKFL